MPSKKKPDKVFAPTAEDAATVEPEAQWVTHGTCPKCGMLLARSSVRTEPMGVDEYTVACDHGKKNAKVEDVLPVWDQVSE